jgi:hypothetical protein
MNILDLVPELVGDVQVVSLSRQLDNYSQSLFAS